MRPRLGAGGVLISTVLVSLMVAIPAAVLWPVYRDSTYLVSAGGAIVAGALVALLGARFRWPSFVVVIVAAALFVAVGVPLALPTRAEQGLIPTWEGVQELVAAVATSWKQLLTITLPVGDYQALLVPAFLTLYVTEIIALSVALRARLPELAVIPPILALVVAILFGPVDALLPLALGLGLLAVALVHLVWWRRRRRRAAVRALAQATPDAAGRPLETVSDSALGARAVLAVLLSLALAGGAAVGATRLLPVTAERGVLREAVEQPFDPRDYPSPLAGFRRYFLEDRVDQVMFTVDGLPDGARIRLATLDSYDGVVAAVGSAAVDAASGTFVRIPRSVDRSDLSGDPVTLDVEIGAYSGVWVPLVGAFESVAFRGDSAARRADAFYFNTVVDTGAVLGGVSEGDAYRVTAILPDQPAEEALEGATPGAAVVARVDGIPEELGLYLDEQVATASTPGARLLAMLAALRRDGYISHGVAADEPASRSGHGADRLAELVTAPRMIGDAEQYAVAAALMARQLGFPARVVMGFEPQDGVVRGGDVTAWIEVDTAENGWVAVDPVPEDRPIPEEEPDDATQVARPPSIVPPPPDRVDSATDPVTPESTQDDPEAEDPVLQAILAVARGVAVGLLVVILVLAPFLLVVAAKARRRRLRRRAANPVDRIRGGWDEWVDTVVDHGFSTPPAATRAEVAVVVGGLPARVLAAATDRAVFAPEQVDPADADRVWAAVSDLRTTLAAGTRRRNRLRALVSLRSLGASSVRSVLRREGKTRR